MIEIRDTRPEFLSDWVEFHISRYERDISQGELSALIEGAFGEEPEEGVLSVTWNLLKEKQGLYLPKPFLINELNIENQSLTGLAKTVQQSCLILALFGSRDQTIQALFENISHLAIQAYFKGESELFAWRGNDIETRLRNLAGRLGEKFCASPPQTTKDAGVDVVAWKPFPDRRSGKTVLLAQCASGRNWEDKHSVPLRRWNQYFLWANDPVDAYTIPYFIPAGKWHWVCRDFGIFFDRIRLVNLLSGIENFELNQDLENWLSAWLSENEIN